MFSLNYKSALGDILYYPRMFNICRDVIDIDRLKDKLLRLSFQKDYLLRSKNHLSSYSQLNWSFLITKY